MSRFSIVKKGYSIDEVEGFIGKLLELTEEKLTEQAQRINELKKEVKQLNLEKSELKAKENSVSLALTEAVKRADEIERTAEARYAIELNRLRTFRARFDSYVQEVSEHSPMFELLQEFEQKTAKLEEELVCVMQNEFCLDKKVKESNYLPQTNGFDLQEALTPKETLEEICKELGLI